MIYLVGEDRYYCDQKCIDKKNKDPLVKAVVALPTRDDCLIKQFGPKRLGKAKEDKTMKYPYAARPMKYPPEKEDLIR